MDGAIDSAAAQQRSVPGVNDRIEFERRDVAHDNAQCDTVHDVRCSQLMHAQEDNRCAALAGAPEATSTAFGLLLLPASETLVYPRPDQIRKPSETSLLA